MKFSYLKSFLMRNKSSAGGSAGANLEHPYPDVEYKKNKECLVFDTTDSFVVPIITIPTYFSDDLVESDESGEKCSGN